MVLSHNQSDRLKSQTVQSLEFKTVLCVHHILLLISCQDVPTNVKDQQWSEVIDAAEAKVIAQRATDAEVLRARYSTTVWIQ